MVTFSMRLVVSQNAPFLRLLLSIESRFFEQLQENRRRHCFFSLIGKSYGGQQLVSQTRLTNQSLTIDNLTSL
jgi:hypothetical protein